MRLFEQHQHRKIRSLEGTWDFQMQDGEHAGKHYLLPVPGCWEMHPDLLNYRGKGTYRKVIVTEREAHLRFLFQGVSHTAEVYFDGKYVTRHYNAYTAFDALIKGVSPGTHTLEVRVDNGFHEASSLHMHNDYYTYGGIIRSVEVQELEDAYIERLEFVPSKHEGLWQAEIKAVVINLSDQKKTFRLQGQGAGESLDFEGKELRPHEKAVIIGKFTFPEAKAWIHESPNLYHIKLKLSDDQGNLVDDLTERVGFRIITTHRGRIQVNDQDIVLRGFNRHEDHGIFGASFPLSAMAHDLDLMKEMGCNSVRTSHYPNDPLFLDLCDERGFYVWEENHARGLNIEQMRNPNFIQQCEDVNREMVEQHYNHPSIIIWAILNECASNTEEGRVHYKRQLEQIRELDDSRPLTFASHHRDRELCFDLADIVSFNLYPGWYGPEDPGELCDAARRWADEAGGFGKPMIMSEFGADAVYGYRHMTRVKGTEERQADIIEQNLIAYEKREFVSGMYIWQFCDCRVTEEEVGPLWRITTQNLKGVVDTYRRPKLAFETVKQMWNRDDKR
ncbi:glycoside hydrolase family 2 protein [Paenibacillus xylanilyticus]|uniref:glycoside hydrolase family 2 protein n=1 Tax=Paenibacillus xylanilyticus TaxID=248903 RepID=UPI0039A09998